MKKGPASELCPRPRAALIRPSVRVPVGVHMLVGVLVNKRVRVRMFMRVLF